MSNRCDFCGKGRLIGRSVSFSQQRTRRIQKPNLHKVRLVIDGRKRKLKLCTKCLRRAKKKYSAKQNQPAKKATTQKRPSK